MSWLTDFQTSLREPVFGFIAASWQYLLLGAIGLGWLLLYGNARRNRAATGDGGGDSGGDWGDGGHHGDGGGDGGGGD